MFWTLYGSVSLWDVWRCPSTPQKLTSTHCTAQISSTDDVRIIPMGKVIACWKSAKQVFSIYLARLWKSSGWHPNWVCSTRCALQLSFTDRIRIFPMRKVIALWKFAKQMFASILGTSGQKWPKFSHESWGVCRRFRWSWSRSIWRSDAKVMLEKPTFSFLVTFPCLAPWDVWKWHSTLCLFDSTHDATTSISTDRIRICSMG